MSALIKMSSAVWKGFSKINWAMWYNVQWYYSYNLFIFVLCPCSSLLFVTFLAERTLIIHLVYQNKTCSNCLLNLKMYVKLIQHKTKGIKGNFGPSCSTLKGYKTIVVTYWNRRIYAHLGVIYIWILPAISREKCLNKSL